MPNSHDSEEIEVRLFLDAIQARYGYDLRGYASPTMRRRVMATLVKSGLAHLGELQHRVLHDPEFFASTLHDLTVHVSEMFRDPAFYRAFRALVVPMLHTYPLIRIWHAGCASGEEAYASAIMLTEAGLYDRSQIYATDLSPQTLATAKEGMYQVRELRTFAENYANAGGGADFASYYTAAYDRIAMKDALRRNILFFQHDLVNDHVFGEMHVIFCRNVFIYFGDGLRGRVIDKFSQSLCPGGFLCLGSSERMPTRFRDEFSELSAVDRIYRHTASARQI